MEADVHSSRHLAQLRNAQAEFLNHGGFPETLLIDHKHRTRLLQEYFNVLLYRFSEDTGKALENAVYLELRRTGTTELFFYRNEALECDFLRVERGRMDLIIRPQPVQKNQGLGVESPQDKSPQTISILVAISRKKSRDHTDR